MKRRKLFWLERILPFAISLVAVGCDAIEASPYPVIKSDLVVTEVNTQINLPRFQWLNNHQLVVVAFDHEIPRPNNRAYLTESLVLWDITTNKTTQIVEPDVGGLCLKGDQIKYFKRKTDPEGVIPRDSQQREHFVGPLGKGKAIDFQEPTDAMTCDSKKTQGGLPEWTKSIPNPEINIRRLQPEHGFLVVKRSAVEQEVNEIAMYAPQAPGSLDVSKLLGGRPVKRPTISPRYFEFKKAYLVESVSKDIPAWWLYPDGQIEKAWRLSRGDMNVSKTLSGGLLIPTAVFPIFGANTFEPGPIGDNGLYSFAGLNNPKRIVKGRIAQELEVSPDGCKVAFANDDRPTIDPRKPMFFHKLQVINLCPEKPL